jgi:hypothetical protein
MILETEKQAYSSLAIEILNLDPGLLSCVVISSPEGSILAKSVKPEFRIDFSKLSGNGEGMAAHWALLAFNTMKRLDEQRSKTKCIVVVREEYNTIIFPANFHGAEIMLIMSVSLRTHLTQTYEQIMKTIRAG